MNEPKRYKPVLEVRGRYIPSMDCPSMREDKDGEWVSLADYARIKKQYDDLQYCRGHVPYAQHRSAVDKWTELFHKTADNFDKVVAENARHKAEVERLKAVLTESGRLLLVDGEFMLISTSTYLRLKKEGHL